jgi:nitroimidazol reductase NimA-like FMN-containing flavoprotein (pyridoxamine 5'-phosphate oxidase superfamily)
MTIMSTLVELTAEECLSLLRTKSVGRIGLVTPGGPMIFPVNYALSEETIVFRTLPYGVIANNAHLVDVAFEVDSLDEEMREGWSVLAVGRSHRIEDPDEVRVIRSDLDPTPWVDGQRNLYFRIEWTNLSGRQLGLASRPSLIPPAPAGS